MAIINIDGREMEFAANAATPIRFKQIFKTDLMRMFQDTENADHYEAVTQLAYIMNAQAEGKGFSGKSFDDYCTWLEGFTPMAFLNVAEEIVAVWTESETTTSTPKK